MAYIIANTEFSLHPLLLLFGNLDFTFRAPLLSLIRLFSYQLPIIVDHP